ncbi:MAG: hypothetical protein LBF59_10075 [Prevotellaceae bacterium]|jgi:hypothetical protein|nr:hypothetical protein [Prevotellaceae bacterium]
MKRIYNLLIATTVILSATACYDGDGGSYYGDYSGSGKGGSMARFCIVDSILLTVDNTSLNMFDISDPGNPVFLTSRTQQLGFGIETIFPMDSLLFIGSQMGMYIYYISKYGFPQYLSTVWHITSCDPVVAHDNYAYVTLNSNNTGCGRTSNLLQIYDISDLKDPKLVKEIPGFASPMGLGVDGDRNKLFVCDNGLKVYDISERTFPLQTGDMHTAGVHDVSGAYDVIPLDGLLILVASTGIYQLDYRNETLKLLSKIEVNK